MLKEMLQRREIERQRQLRKERVDTARKAIVTAGIGTAVGAALGILFAPKSGKETREDVVTKTKEVTENVKEKAIEVKDKASEIIAKTKGNTEPQHNEEDIYI